MKFCAIAAAAWSSATAQRPVFGNDARIEIHGPGYSKIVIGEDCVDEWEQYLDVMVASIAENGGRSCVNASGVWAPRHAEEISHALAERLARIVPRAADDRKRNWRLLPIRKVAARIIDNDRSRVERAGRTRRKRVVSRWRSAGEWEGCSYLLPTIIHCEDAAHPLANREFLFPFATVVKVNQDQILESLGPSLVVTAITNDPKLVQKLVASPHVDRLNLGTAHEPGELGSAARRQSV